MRTEETLISIHRPVTSVEDTEILDTSMAESRLTSSRSGLSKSKQVNDHARNAVFFGDFD
jgi:hypothetical protein